MAGLRDTGMGSGVAPAPTGSTGASLPQGDPMTGAQRVKGGSLADLQGQGSGGGGQLFPGGLDPQNLLSDEALTVEEKLQSNDASTVGQYVSMDDGIRESVMNSVKENPDGAMQSVIDHSVALVRVFNNLAAGNDGITGLQWFSGVDAIIDAMVDVAKKAGAKFGEDDAVVVLPEVVSRVRDSMIERGWVQEEEMQMLADHLQQKNQSAASAPMEADTGLASGGMMPETQSGTGLGSASAPPMVDENLRETV